MRAAAWDEGGIPNSSGHILSDNNYFINHRNDSIMNEKKANRISERNNPAMM